jgi:ATP-dependent exoDNAse (exonuclease V) alpha subunit
MAQLLGTAEKVGSRVVLVGDVKQLGSVEAGNAFGQLQTAGMETHRLTEIVRQTNDLTKQAVYAAIEGDARKALTALESGGGQVQQQETPEERFAAMARDYAALTEAERKQTIVIEPSVAGRETLTAEIRRAMVEAGQLTGPAVSVRTLESRGLTKAETKDARSFAVGDVVMFGKDYASQGVTKATGYEIDEIRVPEGRVSLVAPDGKRIDWTPRQWGAARVDVFRPAEREIRNGDRIEFTRNDHKAGRENGTRAQVLSVDPARNTARIRDEQNRVSTLRLDQIADQHIRHGYVQTNFAAQGRTADRVLAHVESFRTNLVDQKSFYVSISRARQEARLYTDDREKLIASIRERSGVVQEAGVEMHAGIKREGLSLG